MIQNFSFLKSFRESVLCLYLLHMVDLASEASTHKINRMTPPGESQQTRVKIFFDVFQTQPYHRRPVKDLKIVNASMEQYYKVTVTSENKDAMRHNCL